MQASPVLANEAGRTIVETGRTFSSAGIDGLILYALVLAAGLLFVALIVTLYLQSKERAEWVKQCADTASHQKDQAQALAKAASEQAEANKALATAIASSSSADMAFKTAMGTLLVDLDRRVKDILEGREPHQP